MFRLYLLFFLFTITFLISCHTPSHDTYNPYYIATDCELNRISTEGISGRFLRPDSTPVTLLQVYIFSSNEFFETITDEMGHYSFRDIPVGNYLLSYETYCLNSSPLFLPEFLIEECGIEKTIDIDYHTRVFRIDGVLGIFNAGITMDSVFLDFAKNIETAQIFLKNCSGEKIVFDLETNTSNWLELEPINDSLNVNDSYSLNLKVDRSNLNQNSMDSTSIIISSYSNGNSDSVLINIKIEN